MTWRKTGSEFDDECALVDLSNGAYRTHMEAIGYLYNVELMSCRFPKRSLPRFAASPTLNTDITELLNIGFWKEAGAEYEQSLAAQGKKRERDKAAQRRHREKESQADNSTEGTPSVSADVSADVSGDTDRQTDKHLEGDQKTTCKHRHTPGVEVDPWLFVAACDLCQKQARGESA